MPIAQAACSKTVAGIVCVHRMLVRQLSFMPCQTSVPRMMGYKASKGALRISRTDDANRYSLSTKAW